MTFEMIEYSVEQGIATIRLNRPDKMNSFNVAMHQDLRAALKKVKADASIRCLVITGNGKAFSAILNIPQTDSPTVVSRNKDSAVRIKC